MAVPAFNNPPIEPQFYTPSQFFISAIDRGSTTLITTSVDNNYVIGQQIRLLIPNKYGARGLNEQTGFVIAIPASNQVTLDINSNNIDPFIPSPTFVMFESKTPPQIMAIGDSNSGQINQNGRVNSNTNIPGSFINISPA